MAVPPCDECGGTLNNRFPLRLLAEGGPSAAPTTPLWVCLACIGNSLVAFASSAETCPACADLADIFGRLAEAVKGHTDDEISAIHVPPNRHPHVESCIYGQVRA